jgi:hypothetical protein
VQAGLPHYICPLYALMRDHIEEADRPLVPLITDSEALWVDHSVSRLYQRDPEMGTALWNYHRYDGMTFRRLGRLMGITHMKAQELVRAGEAWIDARLCVLSEAG